MNSSATAHPLPVFVYGTLMMGQPNDHMWQDGIHNFAAAFTSNGCLYDVGYYPIMIEKPQSKVMGQLVWLEKDRSAQIIHSLDSLEGFDPRHPQESDFRRVQMQVSTDSGNSVMAWTYIGNEVRVHNLPLIAHGDWAKHVAGKGDYIAAWWEEIDGV